MGSCRRLTARLDEELPRESSKHLDGLHKFFFFFFSFIKKRQRWREKKPVLATLQVAVVLRVRAAQRLKQKFAVLFFIDNKNMARLSRLSVNMSSNSHDASCPVYCVYYQVVLGKLFGCVIRSS